MSCTDVCIHWIGIYVEKIDIECEYSQFFLFLQEMVAVLGVGWHKMLQLLAGSPATCLGNYICSGEAYEYHRPHLPWYFMGLYPHSKTGKFAGVFEGCFLKEIWFCWNPVICWWMFLLCSIWLGCLGVLGLSLEVGRLPTKRTDASNLYLPTYLPT